MSVTDTKGCSEQEIERLVTSVQGRIEECHGEGGGKVRIRIGDGEDGHLHFDVEPGSTLNPAERTCILDALATLDGDNRDAVGVAPPRPHGFTSLVTIEW